MHSHSIAKKGPWAKAPRTSGEELLKRTTQFEMAGPARHVSSVFVRTPAELPIALQTSR